MKSLLPLVVVTLLVAILLPSASAVPVDFSGGGGSPLSLTLPDPVTFEVTQATSSTQLFIDFQGVGDLFGFVSGINGDITYSINGGPSQSFGIFQSGIASVAVAPTDLLLVGEGAPVTLHAGDVVVLSAGTLTDSAGLVPGIPVSGDYQTFLVGTTATGVPLSMISAFGTVPSGVPDSGSTALLLGLCFSALVAARKAVAS